LYDIVRIEIVRERERGGGRERPFLLLHDQSAVQPNTNITYIEDNYRLPLLLLIRQQ
jgi:hypothetical protein